MISFQFFDIISTLFCYEVWYKYVNLWHQFILICIICREIHQWYFDLLIQSFFILTLSSTTLSSLPSCSYSVSSNTDSTSISDQFSSLGSSSTISDSVSNSASLRSTSHLYFSLYSRVSLPFSFLECLSYPSSLTSSWGIFLVSSLFCIIKALCFSTCPVFTRCKW